MINIIIVEDKYDIRQSLKRMFNADNEINVIGEAENGLKAIKMAKSLQPDLVLMEAKLPKLNGLEAAKQIKAISSVREMKIKTLILSTFYDDEFVIKAKEYGVDGYLLKGMGFDKLASAIKACFDGVVTLDPVIYEKQSRLMAGDANCKLMLDILTKSEFKILMLIVKGIPYNEIAAELFLTEGTVRNNVSNMMAKLGCKNCRDLVVFGIKAGL